MNTRLDLPDGAFVAPDFRRKPKIACLPPEVGPNRRRAYGRFKLGVRFHQDRRVSLPVKPLVPGAPPAAPENQTDRK